LSYFNEIKIPELNRGAYMYLMFWVKRAKEILVPEFKTKFLDEIVPNYKKNIILKKKFDNTTFPPEHLLVEFDSCILSDNETYKTM
jgi:hypothetical protein